MDVRRVELRPARGQPDLQPARARAAAPTLERPPAGSPVGRERREPAGREARVGAPQQVRVARDEPLRPTARAVGGVERSRGAWIADHVRVATRLLPHPPGPTDEARVLLGDIPLQAGTAGLGLTEPPPLARPQGGAVGRRGALGVVEAALDRGQALVDADRLGVEVRREHDLPVVGEAGRRQRVVAGTRPQHARLEERDPRGRQPAPALAGADRGDRPCVEGAERSRLVHTDLQARMRLVEQVVADHVALAREGASDPPPGLHELGLDAVAVGVEGLEGLRHGG